jgi:DnaK suppressor protein
VSTKKPAKKAASAPAKAAAKPAASKARTKSASPAKAAPRAAAKPVAKSAAKPAAKPAKAAAKPGAKPAARPTPRPAAKSAAKPTPRTTPRPVTKTPTKAVAQPAPKASPKAAAAPKPAAKSAAGAAPAASPAPAIAAAPLAPPTPAPAPMRMSSSAKSKASAKAQAAYAAPAPLPVPTSRFADRFAPPRPPTRQMSHLEVDSPKQPQKSDPRLANAWKTKAGRDLSDAELLAMPESEYMNDKQLEFFRATLQRLKDDLLSNAGETTEHLREDTSIVPDPADRATIEEEHALELRTRDRERKLLKKISQSLARIEAGDYGFCDETGEPIGLGRLLARPTATLSLEAQQRRELKQKMFGD